MYVIARRVGAGNQHVIGLVGRIGLGVHGERCRGAAAAGQACRRRNRAVYARGSLAGQAHTAVEATSRGEVDRVSSTATRGDRNDSGLRHQREVRKRVGDRAETAQHDGRGIVGGVAGVLESYEVGSLEESLTVERDGEVRDVSGSRTEPGTAHLITGREDNDAARRRC